MASSRTDNFALTANGQIVECRIVYPYLGKKRDKDWQNKPIDPKDQEYECTILIPKRPDDLLQQPYVGPKDLVPHVWAAWAGLPGVNGQWRPGGRWPILDCDIVNPPTGGGQPEKEPFAKERPWSAGHWRIKASSNFPVRVFDQMNNDIGKDVYGDFLAFKGGDYAAVSIHAWGYVTGSGGVGFGIEAVKKIRDGEAVGGGQRSPEQIFGGAPAPSAAPPLPAGFQNTPAPPIPSYGAPPPGNYGYAPQVPQPGFQAAPPQANGQWAAAAPSYPAYATGPSAPSAPPAAGFAATPYPSSGAPVYGGAPPAPYAQGGMPPAPPPPFGTR